MNNSIVENGTVTFSHEKIYSCLYQNVTCRSFDHMILAIPPIPVNKKIMWP